MRYSLSLTTTTAALLLTSGSALLAEELIIGRISGDGAGRSFTSVATVTVDSQGFEKITEMFQYTFSGSGGEDPLGIPEDGLVVGIGEPTYYPDGDADLHRGLDELAN